VDLGYNRPVTLLCMAKKECFSCDELKEVLDLQFKYIKRDIAEIKDDLKTTFVTHPEMDALKEQIEPIRKNLNTIALTVITSVLFGLLTLIIKSNIF